MAVGLLEVPLGQSGEAFATFEGCHKFATSKEFESTGEFLGTGGAEALGAFGEAADDAAFFAEEGDKLACFRPI